VLSFLEVMNEVVELKPQK